MNPALSQPAIGPELLRRARGALVPALGLLALLGIAWWLLSIDRVTERVRQEDVEMIDIAVPPPPPPPPPEEVQTEVQPDPSMPQAQSVQPDPLSPPQPATTNPPAGDLNSLLQDPTADSGAFSGGARGQGGTGKGPLIGGIGRGSGASRAYAEKVMLHIRRTLQRSGALKGKAYKFRLRVTVSPSGGLSIAGAKGVEPADLEAAVSAALRGVPAMDSPPPEGMPNFVNVEINQT
jgi:outer membrane biosynthesis protein TonB